MIDATLASLRAKRGDGVVEDAGEAQHEVSEEAAHAGDGEVGVDDCVPVGAVLGAVDPGGGTGGADEEADEGVASLGDEGGVGLGGVVFVVGVELEAAELVEDREDLVEDGDEHGCVVGDSVRGGEVFGERGIPMGVDGVVEGVLSGGVEVVGSEL